MNDEAIRRLARLAGIAVDWVDAAQRPRQVSPESLRRILSELGFPCASSGDVSESTERLKRSPSRQALLTATVGQALPFADAGAAGRAELVLEDGGRRTLALGSSAGRAVLPPLQVAGYHQLRYGDRELAIAVAPPRCFTVSDLAPGRRLWGLGVQIYSLRRRGDLGIGDTTALQALAESAGRKGVDALALSPMHSLFPSDPERYAPYSPSSRLFLNPLLADPAAALGGERVDSQAGAAPGTEQTLIDWPAAARAKYGLLRRLFDDFAARDLANRTPLASRFDDFVRDRGASLQAHAQFEAQQDQAAAPVEYFLFLQWITETALAAAQTAAKAAGMRIGLIGDLAVGVDRAGSEVGTRPGDFLGGLSLGAPPDRFNPAGQDWGLTSFSPQALRDNGFAPFIATLRANLRHAGGVRIDHAMGLMRLWLVPHGTSPAEGAYLAYPVTDLVRLLALESHRHRAVVIGEDLGTVPPEFRRRCRAAGIAGMDVLWFQREDGRYLPSHDWRRDAVAMTTTHDLPTVAGWWQGADLELRRRLGMADEQEIAGRSVDRAGLWRAFAQEGVATGPAPRAQRTEPVVDAAIAFVARSPAPLAVVPIEDMTGTIDQPNLPGTTSQHPNWRRRFTATADKVLDDPAASRRAGMLRTARS